MSGADWYFRQLKTMNFILQKESMLIKLKLSTKAGGPAQVRMEVLDCSHVCTLYFVAF